MRSIRYILNGKPNNRYDCIDYAKSHKLNRIFIELVYKDEINEQWSATMMIAAFVWVFDDTVILYNEKYGAWYHHEEGRKLKSTENANRRFVRDLQLIRTQVIVPEIEGQDKKFKLL